MWLGLVVVFLCVLCGRYSVFLMLGWVGVLFCSVVGRVG